MSMQDPIADMLTRIRNAHHRSKPEVTMPSSKLKASVAKVLLDEGYIGGFNVSEEVKPTLTVDKPVIEEITRMSKPSLRLYVGSDDLPKVRSGLGVAIVSTGEVLCTVF